MIFIKDSIPAAWDLDAEISRAWVFYEDFEERFLSDDLPVPGNSHIFLRLRVLYAHASKVIDNKPKHRFAVEYITLGKWDYTPTSEDIQMAYDYARQLVEDNLPEWSKGEDALAGVAIPTKEGIERLLESHT